MFFDAFIAELDKIAIEGKPLSHTMRDAPWYRPSVGGRRSKIDPFKYMEGAKELQHVKGRLRNLRYTSRALELPASDSLTTSGVLMVPIR